MKLCHKMKVYKRGSNGDSRPEIRLLGKWLDKLGFGIGQEICVTILDDNRIMIERDFTPDAKTLNEIASYFDKELDREEEEKEERAIELRRWIRDKGGISSTSRAADIFELRQKESGFKGKASLVRKAGKPLDILRDEAEWEGIISPGTSTDDFGNMIKQQVLRS